MKITVIGGSRGTGREFTEAAIEAGHELTVLSRSGDVPENAHAVVGSATDSAAVREAVTGADAVVVTVGGARGKRRQRTEITREVIYVMNAAGVRRLIVQSSLGAGGSASQLVFPMNLIAPVALAFPLADHNDQEDLVRQSGLDWTIVRPTGLSAKDGTGTWKALTESDQGKLGASISREDLAALLLDILTDEATFKQAIGVGGA